MSQRLVKHVEAARPLKSRSQHQISITNNNNIINNNNNNNNNNKNNNNYMLIEELIQLIENVAASLATGVCSHDAMMLLLQNLRVHGPQLESVSKDSLDKAFVIFRNASQDERLNIMSRLNLLELIELRAKSWKDDGNNAYYKHKATNVEPENTIIIEQSSIGNTSPPNFVPAMSVAVMGQQQQQLQHILGPGEIIRNSGKFSKPTKIPGKNYSKDEVVIRNADSGKVMGIKGRRVHMIEELSETIISFQRVNPGAKERLVQITGPNEEKINYAKQLIEDTIRRNASPVRLEPTNVGGNNGGSCSSLASSNSDETNPRAALNQQKQQSVMQHQNRNSIGAIMVAGGQQQQPSLITSTPNFIPSQTHLIQKHMQPQLQLNMPRINQQQQQLLHSFSTNDATLGEYKYTVNVGQHLIKITGDCCELVRVAKLVLDDYFSSNDFLASVEAGAAFDYSTPTTPMTPMTNVPQFTPTGGPLITGSSFADSGIGLNYMAGHITNSGCSSAGVLENDDDEVFIIEENGTTTPVHNLSRSRRSHFSRKDSTPENNRLADNSISSKKGTEKVRIIHEYERLIYYAKSPHSWVLPFDWKKICEKHPSLVRNKDINDQANRFDAEKYLQLIKSGKKRTIIEADETPDNE